MKKNLRSIGVHDGTFHADEVTACALLILYGMVNEDKIIRTRDPEELSKCEYVCDVGGIYDPSNKLFDHHQAEYQGLLSSAGMILQYLKSIEKMSVKEYDFFNNTLILGVDAHDNGRDPCKLGFCSFSHIISNFTPIRYDSTVDEQNQAFHQAVDFVLKYLRRIHERFLYTQSCRSIIAKSMEKEGKFLVFDESIPWIESFFELGGVNHQALFIIMPSSSAGNHWKLRGIPPNYEDRMKVRLYQPMEWAGLSGDDLKLVTGIAGAVFCHKGRFVSVWETKEDALKALKKIILE
jgi:uncharacterized UPF0160 family protein